MLESLSDYNPLYFPWNIWSWKKGKINTGSGKAEPKKYFYHPNVQYWRWELMLKQKYLHLSK